MIRREYGWGLGVILGAVLISCFALPGAWAQGPEGEATRVPRKSAKSSAPRARPWLEAPGKRISD